MKLNNAQAILILVLLVVLLAIGSVIVQAKTGIDLGINLGYSSGAGGGGIPSSDCGTGYDELTGSDSNAIHDSTGASICCPQ